MRLFTFPEAAEHCGVNVKTLRKHAKEGTLEVIKTPLGIRVSEESLFPYLEAKASHQEPEETNADHLAPDRTAVGETTRDQVAPGHTDLSHSRSHQGGPGQTNLERDAPLSTAMSHSAPHRFAPSQGKTVQDEPLEDTVSHQRAPEHATENQAGVPLQAHLAALKLIESALAKAEKAEAKAEEQRNRAELAERRHLTLEMQLRQYQLAMADQAESLAEAQALKQTAELQLNSITSSSAKMSEISGNEPSLPFRVSTSKPSFGRRIKKWLGFSEAV